MVTIEQFVKEYDRQYEMLYNRNDDIEGFNVLVKCYDLAQNEYQDILKAYAEVKYDVVSSDREAAAFMLALDNLNLL